MVIDTPIAQVESAFSFRGVFLQTTNEWNCNPLEEGHEFDAETPRFNI
jgi:hypothetical protein